MNVPEILGWVSMIDLGHGLAVAAGAAIGIIFHELGGSVAREVFSPRANLIIRFDDGRAAPGVRLTNSRGRSITSDQEGVARAAPVHFSKHGSRLVAHVDGRSVDLVVTLDASGQPHPLIIKRKDLPT